MSCQLPRVCQWVLMLPVICLNFVFDPSTLSPLPRGLRLITLETLEVYSTGCIDGAAPRARAENPRNFRTFTEHVVCSLKHFDVVFAFRQVLLVFALYFDRLRHSCANEKVCTLPSITAVGAARIARIRTTDSTASMNMNMSMMPGLSFRVGETGAVQVDVHRAMHRAHERGTQKSTVASQRVPRWAFLLP